MSARPASLRERHDEDAFQRFASRPAAALSTDRQILDALGIRDRIVFPFSPRKAVAALNYLAELRSSPPRVEHPLLELQGDGLTRNLRIRFGYMPTKLLGEPEQAALKSATAKAKKRTQAVIRDLIVSARRAVI